jgi:hypothetical protein
MRSLKLLETTTGRTTVLISKVMAIVTISELLLASIQDGGRCSDIRMAMLQMKEEKLLLLMVELIMKTETLSWKLETTRFTRDGELSTLTSMRKSQLKVNSTKNSDSTWREISMLSLLSHLEDTLT